VRGSRFWRHQLAFRDYLRSHVDAASAYGLLKRHLAATCAGDRRGYTEAKGFFVQAVLRAAAAAEPLFRTVSLGEPEYDGPYLRAGRDAFDGPDRTRAQTDSVELALRLPASARILDAGCGIGTYTRELTRRGHWAVGFDISATFLREVRRDLPSASSPPVVRGSFESLPFAPHFDAVIITGAPLFQDTDELRAVCQQVRSVLRGGGKFLFNYANWAVRTRTQQFPQIFGREDGDAILLERLDWDEETRIHRFEWFRLDLAGASFLRSSGAATAVEPAVVADTVRSSGFSEVEVLTVWDLDGHLPGGAPQPFDETTDRGLVVVATAP